MFGIGPQELVVVALIALVMFGPRSLPQMARELGRFVSEARHSIDEFKEELSYEEVNEVRRDVQESKNERPPAKTRTPATGSLRVTPTVHTNYTQR
jgi:Tat protein translocase TatB subunit